MKNKFPTIIFWSIITLLPILGIIFGILDPESFEHGKQLAQEYIIPFGVFAPFVFIFIQALQVIITPISHYSVGIIGGFIWGPYIGGVLNWTGRMIGHAIAFIIARKIGKKLALKFVSSQQIEKYDKYVSNKSLFLFLFYFLPLFPDDELSYLAGLSKMKAKSFIVANIFGHIGGSFSLAYIGAGIDEYNPFFWILITLTLIGFVMFWFVVIRNNRSFE